nr:glycosyltransferase [Helleborus thibetanus]
MGKIPHIVAVALPSQGHVMPLMEFLHKLVGRGIQVTFVTIESVHQKLVSTLADHNVEKKDNRIHLVSIPQNDSHVAEDIIEYYANTMPALVENVIKEINESDGGTKIDCLVADAHVGTVLEVGVKLGIRTVAFWPVALGVLAFMLHFQKLIDAGDVDENASSFLGYPTKEEIIRLPASMPAMTSIDLLWSFVSDMSMRKVQFAFMRHIDRGIKAARWTLGNSFYELEPASHDFIPNIMSVSPLITSDGQPVGQLMSEDSTCLTWLDQQPVQSVVYIAFGSIVVLNQSQFTEVVHGIELIDQPFIWVVRPGQCLTDNLNSSLLNSFKDRTAHRGKVVDWAPQKKVLAHPSIACFLTHCGWNSTIEGISMGTPLLCWPYFADQFHNENHICDVLKVGLRFNEDETGIITRSEIKAKVQELLDNEGIRSRVSDLRDMAERSVSERGLSSRNIQAFINLIKAESS